MAHQTTEQLEAGMPVVLEAPRDDGLVRLVVRRPGPGLREVVAEGTLDTELGLVGDDWVSRPGPHGEPPSPYAQVTIMNARFAELISADHDPAAWTPCGDQLYLDLDISVDNLPAGSQLAVGEAVLEIQAEPHSGCAQFSGHWGVEALKLANGPRHRHLRLRGANTRVVRSGVVRAGDTVRKL
jgi:MOSC domain-containing protein YiiM